MAKRQREENGNQPVVAFYTQKGGVAKTTTLLTMMARAVKEKKRVLVIDADPQMNTSVFLSKWRGKQAFDFESQAYAMLSHYRAASKQPQHRTNVQREILKHYKLANGNLYDLLMMDCSDKGVTKSLQALPSIGYYITERVTLIASHPMLSAYESHLAFELGNPHLTPNYMKRLSQILNFLLTERAAYDLVLIDLSASNSLLNQMVLASSSFFVMPLTGDPFALMTLDTLDLFLELIEANFSRVRANFTLPKLLALVYGRYEAGEKKITLNCQAYYTTAQHIDSISEIQATPALHSSLSAHFVYGARQPVLIRDASSLFMALAHESATVYDEVYVVEEDARQVICGEYEVLWKKLVAGLSL